MMNKIISFFYLGIEFLRMKKILFLFLLIFLQESIYAQNQKFHTEVLVVGGTTGGIAAGLQSARTGAKTTIIEQTNWLGGMLTAAGVSCTDGNNALPSGLWEEFRQALYAHYQTKNLATGWVSETCFEPHVGDSIFKAFALQEKNLQVQYGWYFDKALKNGTKIMGASFTNLKGDKLEVTADITIDATDLGDVFASAGAGYDLGTEDSSQSGEKIAPGKSNVIQDLTWAATLQDYGRSADKTIEAPPGYDPKKYYCSTSDAPCFEKPYAFNTLKVLDYGKLRVTKGRPNKYMLNWPPHGNDSYLDVVEMKAIDREKAYTAAKNQTLGFIYFLQTTLKQKNIGFAEDEMNKGMAFVPYHREGRRVKGIVRFNIDHIKSPYQYQLYRTGISVGDYPVDHHHGQYPGKVPPIPFPEVPSFNIPLGALIPKGIEGLVVCEKGISVSNIANGTTRLQPVVLLTGQAAGALAANAVIKRGQNIAGTDVREVQEALLQSKCFIMPFVDVKQQDPTWSIIQKIGATGLMEGTGKSVSWANKTYFYPDSLMQLGSLIQSMNKSFGKVFKMVPPDARKISVSLQNLVDLFRFHFAEINSDLSVESKLASLEKIFTTYQLPKRKLTDALTRKEIAVFLNYFYDPFKIKVDMDGKYYLQE